MLTLSAFRLEKGEASLSARKTATLDLISEFGANPYIEEQEKSVSETVNSFNERYGIAFSCENFLRFGRVTRDIMDDEMTKMVRNNPADVVYNVFTLAFFQSMVKMFQNDSEMLNIIMTDKDARERATRHFFMRAQRQAQEE